MCILRCYTTGNILIGLVQGTWRNTILSRQNYIMTMSLGFGVGDVLAIIALARRVHTAYNDAPGDYRNISVEVKSLQILVNKAALHFESSSLSENNRQQGQEVLRGCQVVLEDLNALIEKYPSLASTNTNQIVQRIRLGKEDIAALRLRLISNTCLLNGFIQRFSIPTLLFNVWC